MNIVVAHDDTILDRLADLTVEDLEHSFAELYREQWTWLPTDVQAYLREHAIEGLDVHLQPYYGAADKALVVKARRKQSTTTHHGFASVARFWEGHCFTAALHLLAPRESREDWVAQLQSIAERHLESRPFIVLGDGDFWVKEMLWRWHERGTCFVIRCAGGLKRTAAVQYLEKETATSNRIVEVPYDMFLSRPSRVLTVRLIGWRDEGGAFHCIGTPLWTSEIGADFFVRLIKARFGIETGYRLWNQFRARTSSRNPAIRFTLMAIAALLHNACTIVATSRDLPRAPQSREWRRLRALQRDRSPRFHLEGPAYSLEPPPREPLRVGPLHASIQRRYHVASVYRLKMTWQRLVHVYGVLITMLRHHSGLMTSRALIT